MFSVFMNTHTVTLKRRYLLWHLWGSL